jgi:hypothetical protein
VSTEIVAHGGCESSCFRKLAACARIAVANVNTGRPLSNAGVLRSEDIATPLVSKVDAAISYPTISTYGAR